MIHTLTPYAPAGTGMNLGRAYNEAMARLGPRDWGCLLDHDMMFTTPVWYQQLEAAIHTEPRGAFTAVTNRMAHPWQVAEEAPQHAKVVTRPVGGRPRPGHSTIVRAPGDDIIRHREIGQARLRRRTLLDVTETRGWGGVLMLLSREAWEEAGGFVDGLLCVDHMMHRALQGAGRRVWLIEGLYVYHWQGTSRGVADKRIPRASGCECASIPEGRPWYRKELLP